MTIVLLLWQHKSHIAYSRSIDIAKYIPFQHPTEAHQLSETAAISNMSNVNDSLPPWKQRLLRKTKELKAAHDAGDSAHVQQSRISAMVAQPSDHEQNAPRISFLSAQEAQQFQDFKAIMVEAVNAMNTESERFNHEIKAVKDRSRDLREKLAEEIEQAIRNMKTKVDSTTEDIIAKIDAIPEASQDAAGELAVEFLDLYSGLISTFVEVTKGYTNDFNDFRKGIFDALNKGSRKIEMAGNSILSLIDRKLSA